MDQYRAQAGGNWPDSTSYWVSTLTGVPIGLYGRGIAVDSSGNVYTAGGNPSTALYVQKFNLTGVLQWQKQLEYYATGYAVAVDSASNIYVSFYYSSGSGGLVKYNPSGTVLWQRQLASAYAGYDYAYGISTDSSNNVYITGVTYNGSKYLQLIAKYDANGNIQWQRTLSTTSGNDAIAYSVKVSSAGNVYTVGYSIQSGTFDVQVAKYDTFGTIQWQRSMDSTTEWGRSVAIDSSENVYVFGEGYNPFACFILAKFNSSGTLQWSRTLTTGTTKTALGATVDSAGNVYVTGFDYSTPGIQVLAKYNDSGVIQWQRSFSNLRVSSASYNNLAIDSAGVLHLIAQANIGGTAAANNSAVIWKLPSNGGKTGSYAVGSFSSTYAASSLTEAAGSFTATASGLTSSASSLTDTATSFTSSDSTLTSTTASL
jgi:outer membrane protein assembly factor BamB